MIREPQTQSHSRKIRDWRAWLFLVSALVVAGGLLVTTLFHLHLGHWVVLVSATGLIGVAVSLRFADKQMVRPDKNSQKDK